MPLPGSRPIRGVPFRNDGPGRRLSRGEAGGRRPSSHAQTKERNGTMAVKSVQDLFINELRDIYYAEKQILKTLPKMAKKATHQELKGAFEQHAEQTREQIERIEQVFEMLEVGKRAKRCEAMEGILEEAREHMEEVEDKSVLDPAMIVCAQKVEHYEIAGYGSLVALANQLGHKDAA